jgi:Na+/melibiose symporter-like transporter
MTAAAPAMGRRLGQRDFALLALYWVAIGYLWQSLGTLIVPAMVEELVGSARKGTALAVLEGVGTLMAVVWQPMMGAVSDRTRSRFGRRRPFILGGTVADVVFLAALAISGSYWWLLVAYFLLQAASNTAQGPYQGLQPDVVPEDQRGTASGYYGLANLVGTLAGVVVVGLLLNAVGQVGAVTSIAVLLLATMLLTVTLVPDRVQPVQEPFRSPWEVVRATFGTPWGHPSFLWLMASRLLILMGVFGLQSFALYFFGDAFFPHDPRAANTATVAVEGLVLGLAILVTWPAAWLSDRVGRRALIGAGGGMATAGMLVLLFSGYRWMPAVLVAPAAAVLHLPELVTQTLAAGILVGAGLGAFLSVDWALITDVVPRAEAGLFFGFSNIATAGSGVIARFIAGFLLDRFNAGPHLLGLPGGYPVIFGAFVLWLLVGTLLVLKVRVPGR